MTATRTKRRPGLFTILPVVLIPVAFVSAFPWLKTTGNPIVVLLTAGAAAIAEMSYAGYLGFLFQRGQDEVEKASAGFAAQWGVVVGQIVFVLLLLLPPFLDFATSLVRNVAHEPGASEKVVILAMTLGFCGLVLLQGIASVVVRAIWWRGKR